jgi:uncharacterized membrane protein
MNEFLSGAVFTLCCVAGVFFLRFWRKTRDRFFAFFAAAFWLMALHRAVMLGPWNNEYLAEVYLLRLLAFVLILAAIVDKNRARGGSRKRHGSA